jgi:replicative DNA helicase
MSVAEALSEMGLLDSVGGLKAVAEASSHTISAAMVEQHAVMMVDAYMTRQLSRIGEKIGQSIQSGESARDISDTVIHEIQRILDCQSSSKIAHAKEFVTQALNTFKHAEENRGVPGIKSGLLELDEVTGGWQNGDYIILAARPSTGKTNVALNWIIEAAKQVPVLFYSAEMSGLTVMQRMIGASANLNDRKIKRAILGNNEVNRMVEAANILAESNIWMDDTAAKYIGDIESDVRKLVREKKIGLVVVDYIGKVKTKRARSRQEEVADVSARLKGIAMEHKMPVITLAQLNRNVEARSGVPVLSDLREAGDLEQDADVVIFLHSFERERKEAIPKGYGQYSGRSSAGMLCFVVAKQRTGPICDVFARFVKESGRILPADGFVGPQQRNDDDRLTDNLPF